MGAIGPGKANNSRTQTLRRAEELKRDLTGDTENSGMSKRNYDFY
jgi:hypothetical protein